MTDNARKSNRTPNRTPAGSQMFMRVEEAAKLLGVSRSFAYDMANLGVDTNGAEGLPAIRLGRRLLIKRAALEQWAVDSA